MRITQKRSVVVITILTACVLAAALWPAGSSAGSKGKERLLAGEAPILSTPVAADEPSRQRAAEAYGKLPLSFEVNEGQTDAQVKFISRAAGYNLFLTSTGAVLSLEQRPRAGEVRGQGDDGSRVLRMKLVAANPHAKIDGLDQLPG